MTDILKFPGVEEDPDDGVFCEKCGAIIPSERLEVLPNTVRCVNCSNVKARVGFMEPTSSKGTASEITIIDPADEEALRLAKRAQSDNNLGRR